MGVNPAGAAGHTAPESAKRVKEEDGIWIRWRLRVCQKSKVLTVLNIVELFSCDLDFEP